MNETRQQKCLDGLITVRPNEEGQGMGFICQIGASTCVVTAAHCLPSLPDLANVSSDPLPVKIAHFDDPEVDADALILFVDFCSDVVVLSDANWVNDLCDLSEGREIAYAQLCLRRRKLRIATSIPQEDESFQVHIHTVDREWIQAEATVRDRCSPHLGLIHDGSLSPGTSGAPVFNDSGEVIGIVVTTSLDAGRGSGAVLLASALPHWAIQAIDDADRGASEDHAKHPLEDPRAYMDATGKSVEQIAQELGFEPDQIQLMLDMQKKHE